MGVIVFVVVPQTMNAPKCEFPIIK